VATLTRKEPTSAWHGPAIRKKRHKGEEIRKKKLHIQEEEDGNAPLGGGLIQTGPAGETLHDERQVKPNDYMPLWTRKPQDLFQERGRAGKEWRHP